MNKEIKNIFLMGIGAASLTKKKAEQTLRLLVKKRVITKKQARELVNKMIQEANKAKKALLAEGKAQAKLMEKKARSKGKRAVRNIAKKVGAFSKKTIQKAMRL